MFGCHKVPLQIGKSKCESGGQMETKITKFKKVIAFLLIQLMVISGFGITGWGNTIAYASSGVPTTDVSTSITITDSTSTYVTKQAINVGWFDIRPFMTSGAESYTLSNKILTANALIEAVYFKLYGTDPDTSDLDIASNSTTAQAIRAELNIYNGSWGLSTGSVFGNSMLVMSTINDIFGDFGIGGDEVSAGDNIVFYSYDKDYSLFEVKKITTSSVDYGTVYPVIDVKLKVQKKIYPSTVSDISGAGIYVAGETWCYGYTDSEGVADIEFMRGTDSPADLIITAQADGVIQPYLKISYTWDGSDVSITNVSQAIVPDTSLNTFTANAYGTPLDVSSYVSSGVQLDINNDVESITLSAITADSSAVIGTVTTSGLTTSNVSFSKSTGGSITIPLDLGLNTISFQVKNGIADENYTLKIYRNTSVSDVIANVNRVINGIVDYSGYAESVYDYNWIIGKIGADKTITTVEKTGFLTQVINNAETLDVGAAAKTAIALTALNIDATKVPTKSSDEIVDLVSNVYNYSGDTIPYISYVPYMLMLEDLGNYSTPTNAKWGREELIQYALDHYSDWEASKGDYAGMMIPALAPYYKSASDSSGYKGISQASCAAIKTNIDDVISQWKSLQEPNGSFHNNSDSTAIVVGALASLGIDPNGTDFTKDASGKSALESIFAYETSDHRLGYTSTTYNEYASKDGLQALASYLEYYANGSKNGEGCIYRFTEEEEPYTNWPNADLLTGIKVTNPTTTIYNYSASDTNYTVDTAGLQVTGIFNGDATNTSSVAISTCTISTIDRSQSGTQTVTVTYKGYTATFLVTVKNNDGTTPAEDTVSVTVRSNSGTIASNSTMTIEDGKTTALDVLKTLLNAKGIDYVIKGGYYVSEINGLGEFDKGENSGWLYSVNGTTPSTTASAEYKLNDGDVVLWYYTLDYTTDSSSSHWSGSVATTTNSTTGVGSVSATATVSSSGRATATVTAKQVSSAITTAVDSATGAGSGAKSEVEITVANTSSANSVEAKIPSSSITELQKKVDALTVKSGVANISFDADSLETLAKEASGTVSITASKMTASDVSSLSEDEKQEIGNHPVFDFTVESNGKTISQFGGKVTVTVPYTPGADELEKGIVIYYINDNGDLELVKDCVYDPKTKSMVFSVTHFSTYTVGYQTVDFEDTVNHWADSYITYLAARNVINGMTDHSFAPNSNITRAQFVQILANLAGVSTASDKKTIGAFTDVNSGAWYANAANWAAENGIVTGVEQKDGTIVFNPNTNISRQDMAVMIARFAEKTGLYEIKSTNAAITFVDDEAISPYAKSAVTALQQAGLLNGKTTSNFAPKEQATRGESAKIISILMENSL